MASIASNSATTTGTSKSDTTIDANTNERVCVCVICSITNQTDTIKIVDTDHKSNAIKSKDTKNDTAKSDTSKNVSTKNNNDVKFVYSPTCCHVYCLPCISRVLLVPGYYQRTKKGSSTSGRVITITHGACPVCGTELSYFDLNKITIDDFSMNPDGTIVLPESSDPVVDKVTTSILPSPLLGAKFTTKASTYFKFPLSQSGNCVILYVSKKEVKCQLPLLGDGSMKFTTWKYLDITHTFYGRMKTVMPDDPDTAVEATVWMTLSDNFQFITHGVCRVTTSKRFYAEVSGESYPQMQTKVRSFVHPFGVIDENRLCRPNAHPKKYSPKVSYDRHSFWGNSYFQNGTLGIASYHFEHKPNQEKVAYISFCHPMSGTLTPLDNGQPVPSRVMFRKINCPDQYTFRASICWYDDYHTTWNGIKQWDYEIHFDSQWMCIKSGSVRAIPSNPDVGTSNISLFGKDLVYINAAAYDLFIDKHVANELVKPSSAHHDMEMSMMTTLGYILNRLSAENVMESTVNEFLRVTFHGSSRFMNQNFGHSGEYYISDTKYPMDNVQYYHF